ncbi:HupU protein [Bradyrhizobium sp. AUGA SZCCT0283]|uniref:NADH-quinone oxidoreductase subunit B family protein n=1 Tax=Bradyrhizobium sp. AUGA SZCCT0283 TaxID=2807671 RepID=UPI001BAB4073|nr:HupU protein [Bradyrhizobium sp. AUGA SZCCT0283]MBR1279725.1 HupU protein [Bradyrhizobium sp. AUGA SZCCT0283]
MHQPTGKPRRMNLLWLQSGGCGGCTLSLIGAESPDLLTVLDIAGIDLAWHPSLSEATGFELHELLARLLSGEEPLDILCLEGSVIRGPRGTGRFHMLSGSDRPMKDLIADLAPLARHVVAVGTCAAFGGITAAGDNPSDACGLAYDGREPGGLLGQRFRSRSGLPVINVSGCPVHPGWVVETFLQLAGGTLTEADLDGIGRPRFYADHLVHHGCTRNEYYEFKASAQNLCEMGCMMEHLGCMGTQVHADCNIRLWNGEGSCTRGGYPCISCTEPGFEELDHPFTVTPKRAGIPVGLPTDMPKAWFVALASLSKAATPERLRKNAVADHIVVPPVGRQRKPHK